MEIVSESIEPPESIAEIADYTAILQKRGFIHIKNPSVIVMGEFVRTLGRFVKARRTPFTARTNDNFLAYQTDDSSILGQKMGNSHRHADYIAWYCISLSGEGPAGQLVDAGYAFRRLSPKHQKLLRNLRFARSGEQPGIDPMVAGQEGKEQFYFSQLFWRPLCGPELEAWEAFLDNLQNAPSFTINLRQGDVLLIDNRKMVLLQSSSGSARESFLKQFWIFNKQKPGSVVDVSSGPGSVSDYH